MLKKGLLPVVLSAFLACLVMVNLAYAEKDKNETKRGWLGVYIQDITTDIKEAMDLQSKKGVLVRDVVEDSPADEADIRTEDIILVFDGKKVDDSDELMELIGKTSPDDKVKMLILRDGKEKSISLVLGKTPKDDLHVLELLPGVDHPKLKSYSYSFSALSGGRIGVRVQDLTEQLGDYFGVKDGEGALITEADEDRPAYKAGLRAGDVIVEVDGDEIEDVDELRGEISDKEEGDKVEIKVIRDRKPKTFTVEVEEGERWSHDYLKGMDKLKFLRVPEAPGAPELLWKENEELSGHQEEWKEELKDLKKELKELREELKDLKEELR